MSNHESPSPSPRRQRLYSILTAMGHAASAAGMYTPEAVLHAHAEAPADPEKPARGFTRQPKKEAVDPRPLYTEDHPDWNSIAGDVDDIRHLYNGGDEVDVVALLQHKPGQQ